MGTISLRTNNAPQYNNNGAILSKEYLIDSIQLHPDFQKLFSIDPEVLERITESIRKFGFDSTQPLHLWEYCGVLYLIDGYTRFMAALRAQLKSIPCHLHTEIHSKEEAYQYALRLQINRRNLSQAELLKVISFLTNEYKDSKNHDDSISGRIVEKIANDVKMSPRTVQKYQIVNSEASDELKQDVINGSVSVNQAYNAIKKRKGAATQDICTQYDIGKTKDRLRRVLIESSESIDNAGTAKEMIDVLSFCISIITKELKSVST